MSRRFLPLIALIALSLAAGTAAAAGGPNLYKYKNDKGQIVIENSIPPAIAARGGYQIVSRSGQVIQDVPPVDKAAQTAAQKQRQDAAINAGRDAELRKLYSAPMDAVRLRNRQLDSISIKVDFAKGQLLQLNSKRKVALDQAAQMERKGQAVPPAMRDNLARLNAQATEQENQIRIFEADKEKVRNDFRPIIDRLNVIYPDKALTPEQIDPPAPTAAAPAAAPAPAPAPAAKQ